MKKIFLALAVIATVASCAKDESVESVATSNKAIGFSTLNDRVSRIATDNKDDYKVYADSEIDGETDWYIEDVCNGETDASGSTHYWPKTGTVDFYAYAPESLVANDSSLGTLTLDYAVPATADQDFTVAAPRKDMAATTEAGKVKFTFAHMLSKVVVSAKLTPELIAAGYAIADGADEYTASITVGNDNGSVDLTADSPAIVAGAAPAVRPSYCGSNEFIILPQSYTGATVAINDVKITKNGSTVFDGNVQSITLTNGSIPSATAFEAGKIYMIAITITNISKDDEGDKIFGDQIIFESELVSDWI